MRLTADLKDAQMLSFEGLGRLEIHSSPNFTHKEPWQAPRLLTSAAPFSRLSEVIQTLGIWAGSANFSSPEHSWLSDVHQGWHFVPTRKLA